MTARIPLLLLLSATAAFAEEKTLAQLIREETAGHKPVLTAKGKLSRYSAPELPGVKGKCYVGVVKLKSGAKLKPFIQFVFQRAGSVAYGGPGLHDDGTGGVFSDCPSKSGPLKLQAILTTNPVTDLGEGSYEVTLYARTMPIEEVTKSDKIYKAAVAQADASVKAQCSRCKASYLTCLGGKERPTGFESCGERFDSCSSACR